MSGKVDRGTPVAAACRIINHEDLLTEHTKPGPGTHSWVIVAASGLTA